MAASAVQRYLAEFVGTFGLLLFGGGSAVTSLAWLGGIGFDEPAARTIAVSLSFGFAVVGLAWALGDLSGGHFNPAVTVSMAASGRMPLADVVPYIVAQVLGGILGMAIVLGIVLGGPSNWASGLPAATALGSQCYSWSMAPAGCAFSLGAVFLIEVVLTFVFVLVIQLSTRPESSARNLAPLAIGVTLMVTNLVAIPIDGASLNPARSFAPALVSLYWTSDHWALVESWVFWVAPILGGLLAAGAERVFRRS